jgi:short-subunit dehydrogenase
VRSKKPVVIITGVSSGIGLASAKLFAANDWIVVGTTRSGNRSGELATLAIDFQPAEMARPSDLERLVTRVYKTYGRIDALVANAGYGLMGPLDTLEYSQMQEQLTVNVLAPAELIRRVLPIMKRQKRGVIVGISSVLGRTGMRDYALYSASKFALEGLFESVSYDVAPAGIQLKLVEPSGVDTPFWTSVRHGRATPSKAAGIGKKELHISGTPHTLTATQVAEVVYRAATDGSDKLHYPVGQTKLINLGQRLLPDRMLRRAITKRFS